MKSMKIEVDNVCNQTLAQMCGFDEEGTKEFESTESLIRMRLFSNSQRMRNLAMRGLRKMYGRKIVVERVDGDDGLIYAYIGFQVKRRERTPYILVQRYFEEGPRLEVILPEEDIRRWEAKLKG